MGPGYDTSSDEKPTTRGSSAGATASSVRELRDEVSGLRESRASRAVIEQAKGVLIATTGCTADEAFELLRTQSQHQNRRVRDIAEELVARAVRPHRIPGSGGQYLHVGTGSHRGEGAVEQP